ncbi:macrolide ABC transporter ATP-binding protein [Corynebacterium sp. HMSC05H05]|uniref:ABC transporter ATP-binding protein n=1 Tax=Corynebacterium TaxID=1716 RepID=UPI0008A39A98|nr:MULTISPECIES: ABC transporter ATP-binding protein [Corynebacterium]MDK8799365.1 ABC transporter ATP-binding protein [Corynebacterium coyleae]OFT59434.1 macrolide ABC transporter ATP-binding protein [Corynebacterium sp. HMSC05H05]OHO27654.1 macrolide ABC transporter ATP-binding protein [Corynebacterium sp. HMSC034B08]OHO78262.1 macrolide ABC transporter ATP-binding protein [Corynebacterium sp. HMSC036E10]OHQ56699.1 macrolide ABC transporter ATP-binding protein [Corynebacterium sp. HMSC070H05
MLELNDITKSFTQQRVLEGISLTVGGGESVAIMGPSGSGKSTLLHCMSGVLVPDDGQVRFNGQDVSAMNDAERSRLRLENFGFIFQDGQLLPELTATENVALPQIMRGVPRAEAHAEAIDMLTRLGLGAFVDRYPGQLSGGQVQRVAIARALAGPPSVVFADEPTAALDQATGHEVMQQIVAIAQKFGVTLVLVTHDPKIADWCSRRVEIRDGLIHSEVAR